MGKIALDYRQWIHAPYKYCLMAKHTNTGLSSTVTLKKELVKAGVTEGEMDEMLLLIGHLDSGQDLTHREARLLARLVGLCGYDGIDWADGFAPKISSWSEVKLRNVA